MIFLAQSVDDDDDGDDKTLHNIQTYLLFADLLDADCFFGGFSALG